MSRPKQHIKSGVNIGDVGYLHLEGYFLYLFNIFLPPTDEVQYECPPDLEPLSPPSEDQILRNELFFPPGAALVSKGVEVSHLAASPLDVKFTIHGRESGILVLPDGASREDLISTGTVRDFMHRNALNWYRFINRVPHSWIGCPNGSLYVITGCDKTDTFSAALSATKSMGRITKPPTARYHNNKFEGHYGIGFSRSDNTSQTPRKCTVFIRGMRVAVSARDWTRYILHHEPPIMLPYYHMLTVPVTGLKAKYQTIKERRGDYSEKTVHNPAAWILFHPLEPIIRFLFEESPRSRVAVVEDSLWCPLTDKSDGNLPQIARLLQRILEENDILEENGLVRLTPRQQHSQKTPNVAGLRYVLRVPNSVQEGYHTHRRRRTISNKLAKIFPGPGMPAEMLID